MLKTKAFKPGHICEHVCGTFRGRFVRSRDVKSVPSVALSGSKSGRTKEFLSSGYACRSCPNAAGVFLPLLAAGLRVAVGGSGEQASSGCGFSCLQCPQIQAAGTWVGAEWWEEERAAGRSSMLVEVVRTSPGFFPSTAYGQEANGSGRKRKVHQDLGMDEF